MPMLLSPEIATRWNVAWLHLPATHTHASCGQPQRLEENGGEREGEKVEMAIP
jgi:hypothetical protein